MEARLDGSGATIGRTRGTRAGAIFRDSSGQKGGKPY